MTCLLSKYPVKYVKKILQKLQKFIIYCRQLLPNAWQYRKPATGSSLRTHGDKKQHHNSFYYDVLHIQFYHILFHLFRRINYYFYCQPCMIHCGVSETPRGPWKNILGESEAVLVPDRFCDECHYIGWADLL